MDDVDLMIVGLKARRPEERRRAAVRLGTAGGGTKKALVALLNALADPDGDVRHHAGEALRAAGPAVKPVLPMLIESFGGGEPQVRKVAAHALKKIGPAAVKAVPVLVAGLADADPEIRRLAAAALAGVGTKADKAVPALIGLLADADVDDALRPGRPAASPPVRSAETPQAPVAPLLLQLDPPLLRPPPRQPFGSASPASGRPARRSPHFPRVAGRFHPTPARLAPGPLVDSARLRRPPAPPVRSAPSPQGPVATLPLHLDPPPLRPPNPTGLRSAPAVLGGEIVPEEGRFAHEGTHEPPLLRNNVWGMGLNPVPGRRSGPRHAEEHETR